MAKLTLPEWLAELYPFAHHFFPVDQNLQLHYVDEGEPQGEAVVMLHGNPTWSFYYRHLIRYLSPYYRCLALDHMGCGLSDKPQTYPYCLNQHIDNALRWLEHLALKSFHLVVHDWGGAIGMGIATQCPEKIRSLTILNSAGFLSKRMPYRIAFCRTCFGAWSITHLNSFAQAATVMASVHPLHKNVKHGYLYPYRTVADRIAIQAFVQDIPMNPQHPSYALLESIQNRLPLLSNKPCLLAWGMKDFCFNSHFLMQWKTYFPNAQVQCYDTAGHYVLEDARSRVNQAILTFLQQQ